MEEEYTPQHVQQPQKKSLGKKILNGIGIATVATAKSAVQNVQGLRMHMYRRQLELQKRGGNKRVLPNERYKIVMPAEDKLKLGINMNEKYKMPKKNRPRQGVNLKW